MILRNVIIYYKYNIWIIFMPMYRPFANSLLINYFLYHIIIKQYIYNKYIKGREDNEWS